jgi:nucleotide-binding universal stress UspA family protein
MSGIIVGVDGSAHSGCALEWAMNEAVLRRAPLTVVTVYPVIVGYLGNTVGYPEDQARAERARTAAQEATEKALAQPRPAEPAKHNISPTIASVHGAAGHVLQTADHFPCHSTEDDPLSCTGAARAGFARFPLCGMPRWMTSGGRRSATRLGWPT